MLHKVTLLLLVLLTGCSFALSRPAGPNDKDCPSLLPPLTDTYIGVVSAGLTIATGNSLEEPPKDRRIRQLQAVAAASVFLGSALFGLSQISECKE